MKRKIRKLCDITLKISNDTVSQVKNHNLSSGCYLDSGLDFSKITFALNTSRRVYNNWNNLNDKDIEEFFTINKNINYTNSKFYRYPKLGLPRDKFAILKDKHKSSITRNKDKADYQIISSKFISSFCERTYGHWIDGENAINFFNELYKPSSHPNPLISEEIYNKFINKISKHNDAYLYNIDINFQYWRSFAANVEVVGNRIRELYDKHVRDIKSYEPSRLTNIDLFKEIFNSKNLVLDSDLISEVLSDSVILDEDSFTTLTNVFSSENASVDDLSIALEMMANSNFIKSADIIKYMFWFYGSVMKEATNWNHINVKTLRDFAGFYDRNADLSTPVNYKFLVKYLKRDGNLTDFIHTKIKNKFYKNIITEFVESGPYKIEKDKLVLSESLED